MDQITDLLPITTHPVDPFSPMTTNHVHPPYAEMIIAAITALKDKDGSSRQAISKYIEKEFVNLPTTHATLLNHHLKRLKTEGQLIIVKHSYMLPPLKSAQFLPPGYNVNVNFTDANANVGLNFENLQKRKPGRPPKLKPVPGLGLGAQVQHQMPNVQPYDASADNVPSYQPQFQNLQANVGSSSDFQADSGGGGSEPLFELGDDGVTVQSPSPVVKRGRGRLPKYGGGTIEGDVAGETEGGEEAEDDEGEKGSG